MDWKNRITTAKVENKQKQKKQIENVSGLSKLCQVEPFTTVMCVCVCQIEPFTTVMCVCVCVCVCVCACVCACVRVGVCVVCVCVAGRNTFSKAL